MEPGLVTNQIRMVSFQFTWHYFLVDQIGKKILLLLERLLVEK